MATPGSAAPVQRTRERGVARGPQRVTRHGKAAVIVASEAEWQEITQKVPSFGRLLAQCPLDPEDLPERQPARVLWEA